MTLNYTHAINPDKILKKIKYSHPRFTLDGVRAQQRHAEISGKNNSYFCGAYWRYGFHEDGVVSGLKVVDQIRESVL